MHYTVMNLSPPNQIIARDIERPIRRLIFIFIQSEGRTVCKYIRDFGQEEKASGIWYSLDGCVNARMLPRSARCHALYCTVGVSALMLKTHTL